MEMHEIRYFLALCETLNFTRAAERANVTQPALTRAIQKIEEELGGLLFRRERSRTHLTDLGQLLRPQLEEVLKRSEAVKAAARGFLKLDNAPLKLGVMCTNRAHAVHELSCAIPLRPSRDRAHAGGRCPRPARQEGLSRC